MGTVALPFFTTPPNLHSVNRGKSRPIQTYAPSLNLPLNGRKILSSSSSSGKAEAEA